MKRIVFALAFSLALTACAGMGNLPEEGTAPVQAFKTRCSTCHNLPHPGRHSPDEWDHYLALMTSIMKERNVSYNPENMRTIRAYLHRNARQ